MEKRSVPLWLKWIVKIMGGKQNPPLIDCPKQNQWYWVNMPEYFASDGSAFGFDLRVGSENKLLIFLHGGGVCFDAHMASRPISFDGENLLDMYYSPKSASYGANGRAFGLLSQKEYNPFRNWSVISIPYCTGDFHCGAGDYTYTSEEDGTTLVRHYGYINCHGAISKALEYMGKEPEELLVCGNSAGGFGAALLADSIVSRFPACGHATCYVDSALIEMEGWKEIAETIWQAPREITERLHSLNLVLDSMLALKAKYKERVKLMFSCSIRDVNLIQVQNYPTHRYLYADKISGEQFEKRLREMVDLLLEKAPDTGIFLFDTPAGGKEGKMGLTKHCIMTGMNANKVCVNGRTVLQWLKEGMEDHT